MNSLSDQIGAALVGVNEDAAVVKQQALQGDANPSHNALSVIRPRRLQLPGADRPPPGGADGPYPGRGGGEEALEQVPHTPFVSDLGMPVHAQCPNPRHSTCRGQLGHLEMPCLNRVGSYLTLFYTHSTLTALAAVFAADASGSSGSSDVGAGASAAPVANGASPSRKAQDKSKVRVKAKKGSKKRRLSITYSTKARRKKLQQAKLSWGGVVQVYHVQDEGAGDKKGNGGRPSHSCQQCKQYKYGCSLKDEDGSYEPCEQ